MKQQIPVAAIVAAVVVVLAIVCFIGFRALGPDKSSNPTAPKGMTEEQKAQYESQYKGSGPGGAPGGSSSNMQGYPGSGGGQGSAGSGGH